MGLKDFFAKTGKLLHISGSEGKGATAKSQSAEEQFSDTSPLDKVTPQREQQASLARLEKIEEGFTNMVNHLEGINTNLQNLPDFVENQKNLTSQLIDYIKTTSDKEQRLMDAVQKLPKQNAKENRKNIWIMGVVILVCVIVVFILFAIWKTR